ncbi:MAG: hypothetical protein FWF68_03820 [Spirochaetes bacterium]|nr:hypothetical protein [Spirochaetota bacterium]
MKVIGLSNAGFTAVFGSPVPTAGNGRVLTLTKDDLTTGKFHQAKTADGYWAGPSETGLPYSTVENQLQTQVSDGHMTASQKTQMLNALKSSGVTGVAVLPSSDIGVMGIKRE